MYGLWLLLYTVGVLFNVEWCNRQLSCPSIITCNITSIAHDMPIYQYLLSNIFIRPLYTYSILPCTQSA